MIYFAVLIIAWIIQIIIVYFWKRDKIFFYKKRDKIEKIQETSTLERRQDMFQWIWILFVFILTTVSCFYLYYFNANKISFCKLMLVYFMVLSVMLYDWKEHKIPNKILVVCLIIRSILILVEVFYYRNMIKAILISCIGGTILIIMLLLLLVILTKQGFGMGDVKLFATICFIIGLMPTYNLFFYSILYTAICSIFLLLVKKVDKKYKIPFAPFVLLGYLTTIFFQLY